MAVVSAGHDPNARRDDVARAIGRGLCEPVLSICRRLSTSQSFYLAVVITIGTGGRIIDAYGAFRAADVADGQLLAVLADDNETVLLALGDEAERLSSLLADASAPLETRMAVVAVLLILGQQSDTPPPPPPRLQADAAVLLLSSAAFEPRDGLPTRAAADSADSVSSVAAGPVIGADTPPFRPMIWLRALDAVGNGFSKYARLSRTGQDETAELCWSVPGRQRLPARPPAT